MAKAKQKEVSAVTTLLAGTKKSGFEDATSADFAIPMLSILQKLSPQCDKDSEEFIQGAEAGYIFHNIRKECYEEVTLIPVKYRKVFLEWVLREKGGGFRGEHSYAAGKEMLLTCERNEKGQYIMPDSGHHLSETANYYCFFEYADGLREPIMVSMSSSQLKTSRTWMSQLNGMTYEEDGQLHADLPMDSYGWNLSTTRLENDKGVWYGWKPERADFVLLEVHTEADNFRLSIAAERITYNPDQEAPADNAM